MDSGNSGSLQSSSGGDEEYDSRAADSVSAFMSGGPNISNPTAQPPPFFDPLSNYLQLHHQNPNSSLLNSTLPWPRTSTTPLRSDPNPVTHDIINSMNIPISSPFMSCFQSPAAVGMDNNSPTLAPPPQNQNQAARNPKKRSRASRRAPTTVLTTDTTNFRAMVQEFTGIPAPPFSNSSFPRSRLDLFGTRSTTLDAAQPPPYLRRPFAQKVQPPHPFLASSSSLLSSAAIDAIVASSNPTTNNNITSHIVSSTTSAASSSSPSINYQLQIPQSSSNLFNIPNPLLTSLLQSNPKFPFSTSPVMGSSKLQGSFEIPSNDHSHTKMGGLDEQFGLGHGNHVSETLTGLPNLIPSDQIALRNDDHNDNNDSNNAARWSNNPVSSDRDKDDGVNLRPVNGNYNFTLNSKMNFSASSTSNFHGGKGPENVASRGEGMVESWICSSE